MAEQRTYTAGNFVFEMDGSPGYLYKATSSELKGDIQESKTGSVHGAKKSMANWSYGDIKIDTGIGMSGALYKWMQAAFDKNVLAKSGTITSADFNYKAMTEMTFSDALITEIATPKLSGDDKNTAKFSVTIKPERVRWANGSGKQIQAPIGSKQKKWLCSNFKFEIGWGLPTTRVSSVDALTWKCSTQPDQIGINREPTIHPAAVTMPDLGFSMSYADYAPWADKAKQWFIDGHHEESDETTATVTWLNPTLQETLGTIEMGNVGFKSFKSDDLEGSSDKIKRFTVQMYLETIKFNLNAIDM